MHYRWLPMIPLSHQDRPGVARQQNIKLFLTTAIKPAHSRRTQAVWEHLCEKDPNWLYVLAAELEDDICPIVILGDFEVLLAVVKFKPGQTHLALTQVNSEELWSICGTTFPTVESWRVDVSAVSKQQQLETRPLPLHPKPSHNNIVTMTASISFKNNHFIPSNPNK